MIPDILSKNRKHLMQVKKKNNTLIGRNLSIERIIPV